MELRGLLWVIPLLGIYALLVSGGAISLCRPNEQFLGCGRCQKTCRDPAPVCTEDSSCRAGCYCNDGLVRNDTGDCVKLSECPSLVFSNLESSKPSKYFKCPEKEEYRCESCNKTCENPNPICPVQCTKGCFCKGNMLRDAGGECVLPGECVNSITDVIDNLPVNLLKHLPYQLTCGPHQEYRQCQQCERTCSSPMPICSSNKTCNAGCFCKNGWVKSPSGKCVKPQECPQAEISMSSDHVSIEDCASDEVYLSCGWCEPSCWDPNPACPRGVCTRGCLCKPPLLRHHSGHCVEPGACKRQKCRDLNEEYVCRYGCESRCDRKMCVRRPRICELGCHCKLGLLRDTNGMCVPVEKCSKTSDNLEDIFVNFSRLVQKSYAPTSATSVFGPIKLDITTHFVRPNKTELFKRPNNSKTLAGPVSTVPIKTNQELDKNTTNKEPVTSNPGTSFVNHYITDPFREANEAKTFKLTDLKGDSKTFANPPLEINTETKSERKTGKLDESLHRKISEGIQKIRNSLSQHPFASDSERAMDASLDIKSLNETSILYITKFVNDFMKQWMPPDISVNYTDL